MNSQPNSNHLLQVTPEEVATLVQGVVLGVLLIAFFVGLCLVMGLTLSIEFGLPRV